jgi:hypothetical protein
VLEAAAGCCASVAEAERLAERWPADGGSSTPEPPSAWFRARAAVAIDSATGGALPWARHGADTCVAIARDSALCAAAAMERGATLRPATSKAARPTATTTTATTTTDDAVCALLPRGVTWRWVGTAPSSEQPSSSLADPAAADSFAAFEAALSRELAAWDTGDADSAADALPDDVTWDSAGLMPHCDAAAAAVNDPGAPRELPVDPDQEDPIAMIGRLAGTLEAHAAVARTGAVPAALLAQLIPLAIAAGSHQVAGLALLVLERRGVFAAPDAVRRAPGGDGIDLAALAAAVCAADTTGPLAFSSLFAAHGLAFLDADTFATACLADGGADRRGPARSVTDALEILATMAPLVEAQRVPLAEPMFAGLLRRACAEGFCAFLMLFFSTI